MSDIETEEDNQLPLRKVSSCAFGQVVDDLLVVRDIFSGGDEETEPVKMGKYSKRILVSLGLVVIASIVFGGNFVKIIQDEENLPNTRTVHDFQSSVDFWKQEMCGKRSPENREKMALEWEETPPWYVSIWMSKGNETDFSCGATLVGDWILSSAHCFISDPQYMNANSQKKGNFYELKPVLRRYVLFGDQNTKAPLDKKLLNKRLFQIDPPMYIHLGYNHTTLKNDLIAMRIPKLVPPHLIVPLCFQEVHPKLGEKCWISGGFLSSRKSEEGHVRSDWVQLRNCSETIKTISDINEWSVCSARDGVNSCQGDSGGPLACFSQEKNVWEAAGLISWSKTACKASLTKSNVLDQYLSTDVHTKLLNVDNWLRLILR